MATAKKITMLVSNIMQEYNEELINLSKRLGQKLLVTMEKEGIKSWIPVKGLKQCSEQSPDLLLARAQLEGLLLNHIALHFCMATTMSLKFQREKGLLKVEGGNND